MVVFLPYSDVEPPIYVASFPIQCGSLLLVASEPLPLIYSSYEDRPCIDLTLFMTAHAPLAAQRLQAISLNVKPVIRVKIFYASEPVPCLPKQMFLNQNASIRKLDHAEFMQ